MQFNEIRQVGKRDLRIFAGLQLVFFCLIGWILSRRGIGSEWVAALLTVSALLGIPALWKPRWIRPFYIVWMTAVFPIGWTISHLLMAIVYYGVVTPIGIWRRKTAGDPLQREFDPQAASYWETHRQRTSVEEYFRQF